MRTCTATTRTRAKKLLAEAGYKNGFEFTVYLYTLPGLPEIVDIGQALALDWEAVGLKPKLVEIDFPTRARAVSDQGNPWGSVATTRQPQCPEYHAYFQ